MHELEARLRTLRGAYDAASQPSASLRIERLRALEAMLKAHRGAITDALRADFSARSADEVAFAEFVPAIGYCRYLARRVTRWMRPERRHLALHFHPGRVEVRYQPLGVVGIIVPFNYPVMLTCSPLATALAAGNHAMIKLPEATPETSAVMAEAIASHFPPDVVTAITGGADVSAAFSRLPFDHLLFTGSGAVGRKVMQAAADTLTPVTLELGGKSPVLVDDDVSLDEAAARIVFGKMLNAGQTCVAPDYALVPRRLEQPFVEAFAAAFGRQFPAVANNPDFGGIISDAHLARLDALLADAASKGATIHRLAPAPVADGTRRFAPAIVTAVDDAMRIMQEEIFGPVLPVVPFDALEDAIAYVNHRDRPLALYYFGHDRRRQRHVCDATHSGAVAINETVMQVAVDDVPFGGIGASGMGHYHGHEGFLAMSKAKPVLYKGRFNASRLLYPPYGGRIARRIVRMLLR